LSQATSYTLLFFFRSCLLFQVNAHLLPIASRSPRRGSAQPHAMCPPVFAVSKLATITTGAASTRPAITVAAFAPMAVATVIFALTRIRPATDYVPATTLKRSPFATLAAPFAFA
jgi:hypothetical protein